MLPDAEQGTFFSAVCIAATIFRVAEGCILRGWSVLRNIALDIPKQDFQNCMRWLRTVQQDSKGYSSVHFESRVPVGLSGAR